MKELQTFIDQGLLHLIETPNDLSLYAVSNNPSLWVIHPVSKVYFRMRMYGNINLNKALPLFSFSKTSEVTPQPGDDFNYLRTKTTRDEWLFYQDSSKVQYGEFMQRKLDELDFKTIRISEETRVAGMNSRRGRYERLVKLRYIPGDFSYMAQVSCLSKDNHVINRLVAYLRSDSPVLDLGEYPDYKSRLKEFADEVRAASKVDFELIEIDKEELDTQGLSLVGWIKRHNLTNVEEMVRKNKPKQPVSAWSAGAFKDLVKASK